MAIEYETKVLDINVEEIDRKLQEIGARKEEEKLMKRWIFDIASPEHEWIRVRHNGDKTTIAYKCIHGDGIGETEEIETDVSDFETASQIVSKLPLETKIYQENKRTIYRLNDIEFTIDHCPKIPPYLEIESTSEQKVKEGVSLLGLEGKDAGDLSVIKIYAKYGIDLHSFKELKF